MTIADLYAAASLAAAPVEDGRMPLHHATTRCHEDGVVLAVAAAVVGAGDEPPIAVIGAVLCAELAAEGALLALQYGGGLSEARAQASASLHHGLQGVWTELPRSFALRSLASTLVLAVVMRNAAAVWCSGDGRFGVVAPESTQLHLSQGPHENWNVAGDAGWRSVSGVRAADHRELASLNARRSCDAANRDLRRALYVDGPVVGLHVATQGLRSEPALEALLTRPVRSLDAARGALLRPAGCGDMALAWVAERASGRLGVGELAEGVAC